MEAAPREDPSHARIRIWDSPTRIFHLALVALFAAMWWTGEERMFDWHFRAAYALIALILFRLIWGFAGSETSRFSNFVRSPAVVFRYIRRDMLKRSAALQSPGHNPLGGWSVVVFLAVFAAQLALGMFAVDIDGIESGPLSYLVDFDTGRAAAELHSLIFDGLLVLAALHVAAVAGHLIFKRDNLLGPMITGRKEWKGEAPALHFQSRLRALFIFLLCAGAAIGLEKYLGG